MGLRGIFAHQHGSSVAVMDDTGSVGTSAVVGDGSGLFVVGA